MWHFGFIRYKHTNTQTHKHTSMPLNWPKCVVHVSEKMKYNKGIVWLSWECFLLRCGGFDDNKDKVCVNSTGGGAEEIIKNRKRFLAASSR